MEVKYIQGLLDEISHGEIMLPEFQRGYVWNHDQVRGLMQSLYRKHPTGHLLIWRTYKPSLVRRDETSRDSYSLLLLDGQQRLTTLYVLFKGEAPRFYEGETLFFDLHFNMQTEEFRFWQKTRMENNPAWIGVHELLSDGLNSLLERLDRLDDNRREVIQQNLARLSRLDNIRNYAYTVDQVSGDEFDVDQVVEIFNRVNRAGTPLTKADLALAHVCSIWPEARAELRAFSSKMEEHGFGIDLSFLVRCMAGVATGSIILEGSFTRTPAAELKTAWEKIQPAFEHLVAVLRQEAFIVDLSDLPTPNVLVPATIFLARHDGQFPSIAIKNRFIRWLFLAGLWSRYSGSTDTKLQQDVAMVSGSDIDPTHELEAAILRERGRVVLEEWDLDKSRINSAFALLSRVVARSRGARDWFTGVPIYDKVLGKSHVGENHYIFSKGVLDNVGMTDAARRYAIANRAFLEKCPPLYVGSSPAEYLPEVERNQPGALQAHSVPMDRDLWNPERFLDFLAARRRLLAEAMNNFIASWIPETDDVIDEHVIRRMISEGESNTVEFKSSLRWDRHSCKVNKALEAVVVKTLAGFLNGRNGGTLLIGVDDAGDVAGLAADYKSTPKIADRDGFELHLWNILNHDIGEATSSFLTVNFHQIDSEDICQITVDPSDHPIYVESGGKTIFYLRTGNSTSPLPVDEAVEYVQRRFLGGH